MRCLIGGILVLSFLTAVSRAAQSDVLTPHKVAALRSVGAAEVSPDGKTVAYTVSVPRKPGVDEDGSAWSELHLLDVADGRRRPFITGKVSIGSIGWTPDGRAVSFLSKRDGDEHTSLYVIGADGGGWDILSTVLDLAAVGLAAEQVGGAQFVLEMAVQYAKDRVQFGRPIGSFQAIKHKCADMLLEVESAKSAAYYGLWCASEMNDELPSVASLAKAYCSEAYFHATAENIQIHGGIGFTWEHPAHLYFKRAKSSELLFGDPTYHREQLAQRIGI